ncbi:MAG: multidrug efflux RND transporter permease subunit [Thermoanaerobaculia bacterium]|nr:multidrug efflux RND transporter permease subunit [Thermoanaerobaculia bacterium]MBP9823449.1 multidrug efflux RND transporter permease subunit [Thermoanaerobaculia bacterium]
MISHLFIRRPILATVISLLILLIGAAAIFNLPIAQYPEIAPPQVTVNAFYPGASAETLQVTVAAPIEEQINGVEGMLYLSSTSSSNGSVSITVTFETGTDVDQAATNVSNRVRLAEPRLPEEVRRNGVTVQKQSSNFLQIISMTSPEGRLDPLFLSNYTTLNILEEIKRVPGVGSALIFGAQDFSMRIWLKPDRLALFGLTPADVAAAIREQNAQFAVGRIGQEPTPGPTELSFTVTAPPRYTEPRQFEEIVLRSAADGARVRLADVARVELGARDYDTVSNVNGKPAINMAIFLQPGANSLATADGVQATMREVAKRFPVGMAWATPYDSTRFVRVSIEEVVKTLLEAMVLVFLVVWVFLGSFRATLIPLMAVPVSLIGAFAGMYALGFSINTLTLFGLVLAIGIVVDDAIVVLENVERIQRAEKISPREAAFKAMTEVTGPVIAIVLVLVAVFLPVAFFGGLAGELYRQFAITIAISVFLSGVVALTLTPALCAILLRPEHIAPHGLLGRFDAWFQRRTDGFGAKVDFLIRHKALTIGLFLVALLAVFGLLNVVPGGLVPSEDQGYFIAAALLPDGATLQRTAKVARQVEQAVLADPAVERIVSIVGFDFVGGGSKSNAATFFVILKPWDERESKLEQVLGGFYGSTGGIKEAVIFGFNPPPIQGLGATGGFEFFVQNRGEGSTHHMSEVAFGLMEKANKLPELAGVRTLFRPDVPQLEVALDRERAKASGISVDDVYAALQSTFGTLYVNDFTRSGRAFRVQLQAEAVDRKSPDDLGRVFVRAADGRMMPLSALVTVKSTVGPEVLERFNGFPAVKLLGAAAPGRSSGEAIAAMEKLADAQLPQDFGYAWSGSAFQEKKTGGSSAVVFLFSILVVFLILAGQYESWKLPVAVLLTVPIAVLGALAAVWLRGALFGGAANDIYFQIGLITLIGLASKNAILMVEFATQRRDAGATIEGAAQEAARLRFRPIVMTSLAFVLGVLPLVVSTGAGAASRHSIGTGVFGGMIAATFIAVFFIPVFYVIIARLGERRRRPGVAESSAGQEVSS